MDRDTLALIRANPSCCPICDSERYACPTLEAATPEPDRWCPVFEDALEVREWKRWAYRYRKSEHRLAGVSGIPRAEIQTAAATTGDCSSHDRERTNRRRR
jgi:hypothetical protein